MKIKFLMTIDFEIDGKSPAHRTLIADMREDISFFIPGVICERQKYAVLLNSIEITEIKGKS